MPNKLMAYVAARLRGDDFRPVLKLRPSAPPAVSAVRNIAQTKPRKLPYAVIEVDLISETASVVGNVGHTRDEFSTKWHGGPRCFRLIYCYGKCIGGRASRIEPNEAWERAKKIAAAALSDA